MCPQASKIQDESLYYDGRKHDGSLPLVGVNTFLPPPGQVSGALYEVGGIYRRNM